MKIIFTWKELIVMSDDGKILRRFSAHCNVRNELNGKRDKHEIVKTFPFESPDRLPYMPRQFPSGIHRITAVEYTNEKYFNPVKIRTDAVRDVFEWEIKNGLYTKPTTRIIRDKGYLIHYYAGFYSHGCIFPDEMEDVLALARIIDQALKNKEIVFLEVL
jgi:hypothetical protein